MCGNDQAKKPNRIIPPTRNMNNQILHDLKCV